MRKLVEATLVSLDGVVGSPEEWALPFWTEENKNGIVQLTYLPQYSR
jgi:hypothetical protein